jgi:hypothetical protein
VSASTVQIITTMSAPLTWEEALALSQSFGGTLTSNTNFNHWQDVPFSGYAWTGYYRVGAGFAYWDGSTPWPGLANLPEATDGDPTNNPSYAMVVDEDLVAYSPTLIYTFGTDVADTPTITASPWDDRLEIDINEKIVYLGAGNDQIHTTASWPGSKSVIYGGDGDDHIHFENAGDVLVYDGKGNDDVEIWSGKIRVDPEANSRDLYLALAGEVSYASVTADLVSEPASFQGWLPGALISSTQTGEDSVFAKQVTGGKGNDVLAGFLRLNGSGGNDKLTPTGDRWTGGYASGGDGNDTLIADIDDPQGKVTLLGDAGDDTFIFGSYAEATGGAGDDTYIFEAGGRAKINDLRVGDIVDLSALLEVSISQAFADGYLKTTFVNGYTHLSFDADGGGDDWTNLANFKGVYSNLSDYLLA